MIWVMSLISEQSVRRAGSAGVSRPIASKNDTS